MPKIAAASIEEHRTQLRQRVFEAFTELLAESGYEAITMAKLAERSGLGRTAIYHHFRDKEAVVAAFATTETERYVEHLRALLDQSDDPVERLRIYVRTHLEADDDFHLHLGPRIYGVLSPESREAIGEHVAAVERVLTDLLRDGVERGAFTVPDVDAAAGLIHACLGAPQPGAAAVEEFVLRAVGASG